MLIDHSNDYYKLQRLTYKCFVLHPPQPLVMQISDLALLGQPGKNHTSLQLKNLFAVTFNCNSGYYT
jgi:hypothetical protein